MPGEMRRDGVRWEIDGLAGEDLPALFAWAASTDGTAGEIVKETRARRVARIAAVAGGTLYVKHDRYRGLISSIRFLFTPSRARAEWGNARSLLERKIRTARPLALGERRRLGVALESYLVTEGIEGALALDQRLLARANERNADGGAWRRRLAAGLAGIVAAFHREGFFHRDLHLGNFLAGPLDEPAPALWLIDLHRAQRPRRPGPRHWITDLAWLDYAASPWARRSDRLRFLRRYLREMPAWAVTEADAARAIASASERRARMHRARRARRALRGGPHFVREKTVFGWLHRAEDADQVAIDGALAAVRHGEHAEVLRETPRSRVLRVGTGKSGALCVKGYRRRPLARDRARAAWRAAEGCRLRGLGAPRALALAEGPGETLLVMEDLGHLPWLTHYAALTLRGPGAGRAHRRQFADAAGAWVRHLHASGARHADLKAGNILVGEADRGWRFYLLDLEDLDFPASLSAAERERALAQLNGSLPPPVSRTERLRAFKAYARGGVLGDARATREALRRIVRESIDRKHLWGTGARRWEPEPEGFGRSANGGAPGAAL
ncbi:MAG: lipopolysaccharide kinase InaA family protein [Deltaproteobacteria bacterium]|nr:lipopolysaccharide kinase InaA family protein [Deltaproteobacteria bacterium]